MEAEEPSEEGAPRASSETAGEAEEGPCWLPGPYWGLSAGSALLLLLLGASLGIGRLWTATSISVVIAIVALVILWDSPTARFPFTALLIGLDAGALAAAGHVRLVAPPLFVEADRMGSSLAIDPAALAVIVDVVSRYRLCRSQGPRQRNKTPPPETESNGAAVV